MRHRVLTGMLAVTLAGAATGPARSQTKADQAKKAPSATAPAGDETYDAALLRYLEAARRPVDAGSGTSIDWMCALSADSRARRVNDLLTVRVIESIAASGSADSSLGKASSASASVPKLFGLETKTPAWLDPGGLVSGSSDTTFKGGGTTTRAGELSATMTARVAEVLPGGDLVIEGVREIEINGDRQVLVLTGVVRPTDIQPQNVVLSPQIGQLRIRYFGRGLIKDNLKPGWLVRVLNKIF